MKRILLLVLAVLFTLTGQTQVTVVALPAEYLRNNITGRNNVPVNVQGTLYWDTEFTLGAVSIYGKES